uniref:Ycf20 n=1 Tax=Pseudocodium devriesii TaxID=453070 RepID=A0A386B131_9CHLO|nr:hypothetical protein Ycf20 [Pseudocodium devriesii]AYC65406.1 hypothetical protein Ycf20 [Pseudocodium devriesii]
MFFKKIGESLIRKQKNFLKSFLLSICCFYGGFLGGNLFGTFLNFLRSQIPWDGTILILILLLFEFFNFLIYTKKLLNKKFLMIIKNIQIGVLLGFFIDAFKVGS